MSERLNSAVQHLFAEVFTEAQRNTLDSQSDKVEVRVGSYTTHEGDAVSVVAGSSHRPRYSIAVGPTVELQGGVPSLGSAEVGSPVNRIALLWLRDVADIARDSRDEIARVMVNLNYYLGSDQSESASAWATAISGHSNRASLQANPFQASEVPPAFSEITGDIHHYRETLLHFFTFDDSGQYYQRWSGDGRNVPDDLSTPYKNRNVMEMELERYESYVYAVVPVAFLGATAGPGEARFREIVWGFRWGNDGSATDVRVVHTVGKHLDAGDFYDFVCFDAEQGAGLEMPVSARATVDSDLADFLYSLPAEGDARTAFLEASELTEGPTQNLVRMIASFSEGEPTNLPEGVTSYGVGGTQVLIAPAERVVEIAARDDVRVLSAPRSLYFFNDQARNMVQYANLESLIATNKRGGKGVVVGILDSGLDAQHPAFAGRVISVWDQSNSAGPNPSVSLNASPGVSTGTPVDAVMDTFWDTFRSSFYNFGTELHGPTVSTSRDAINHGTHVTGTAAGAAVTGSDPMPAGMAPEAEIIAVRLGRTRPAATDPTAPGSLGQLLETDLVAGILYIREKAAAERPGAPVVINMSLGHHDHAHDRTAAASEAVERALNVTPFGNHPNMRPAIGVAAAGNHRKEKIHEEKHVADNSTGTLTVEFTRPKARAFHAEVATIWVTNPAPGTGILALTTRVRRPGQPAATPWRGQQATATPHWSTFFGQGVHVGIGFGPPSPGNGDFEIRVLFKTALGIRPDPAGPVVIGGNKFSLFQVDRNWREVPSGAALGANEALLPLQRGMPWEILLRNRTGNALAIHAWLGKENAQFTSATATDETHLVGSPAEAMSVISVASCNSSRIALPHPPPAPASPNADSAPPGALSTFSSPGPIRNAPLPVLTSSGIDITAPGCLIHSARSQWDRTTSPVRAILGVNNNTTAMAGTSQAAPVITGLIANALAEEPSLDVATIRTRLRRCSVPSTVVGGGAMTGPNTSGDWGFGLIEARKLKP